MDHCSSEGATVGIQSYLFKTKISVKKFKTQNNFSSISNQNTFQFHFNINIQIIFQNSFSILHQIQIQIKMQETIHLSDLWEHTITKIFKHDPESELDIMIRQCVIYNKLEDFNCLLNYTDEELIPHSHG